MRVSIILVCFVAFIIACTTVHGVEESDLSGFSINVPGTNNNINSDSDVKVESADGERFQEVNAGAASKEFAMADQQAVAQALGERDVAAPATKSCPHWTQSKELANAPSDRKNPGAFFRTNANENKELFVVGGYKSDTLTFEDIYKLDTNIGMDAPNAEGWKLVTPTFAANFNLEQNKLNRALAAKVWLSSDGKTGDFVVFAAGTDAKKNDDGQAVVYTVKANGDVSVGPMKITAATPDNGMPVARIGASLTKITDNTALLFGGESLAGNTLNDAWKLTRNGDGSYTWSKLASDNDAPSVRTSHTAVANDRKVYIFGGSLKNKNVVDDKGAVFVYDDAATKKWSKLQHFKLWVQL